jgi:uncharacterized protein (TIGR00730 family)
MEITRLAVYCGSSPGLDPVHTETAERLGRGLAERGVTLVYGGAHVGLMGTLADSAMAAGGKVIGVMTEALVEAEVAHTGLPELYVLPTMHERKARMADLGDAFVMLPGGYGTLEEFCEALTWTQLGVHDKPCAVLDPSGYFSPLLELFDRAAEQRFLRPEHRGLVLRAGTVDELFERLTAWTPLPLPKWVDRSDR